MTPTTVTWLVWQPTAYRTESIICHWLPFAVWQVMTSQWWMQWQKKYNLCTCCKCRKQIMIRVRFKARVFFHFKYKHINKHTFHSHSFQHLCLVNKEYLSQIQFYSIFSELPVLLNNITVFYFITHWSVELLIVFIQFCCIWVLFQLVMLLQEFW